MSANPITKFWLEPKVTANPLAIKAIITATHIIYAPGSLYGSVLSNFLPKGITTALAATRAQKILLTNLVSTRNQTHEFTPQAYYQVLQKYTKLRAPFSVIIVPNLSRAQFEKKYPKVQLQYASEHAHFLGWEAADFQPLQKFGVQIISAPLFAITPQFHRLRHDTGELGRIFKVLI